ncbi:MAG TPA: hypothetical protein VGL13_06660 [Polyangiaceae bacterium]
MVEPRGNWAFDFGAGVGHVPGVTGLGLNAEFAVGLTSTLELGAREGFRLNDDGRQTIADDFGRLFDTETFGTGRDDVANPEIHIRDAIARGDAAEVGLEARAYLPIETGTHFGFMFGLPVHFHLGGSARLDTGVYVPVLFDDPTRTVISVPVSLWFQSSPRFWLGPISAFHFHNDPGGYTQIELGLGLGYQFAHQADFKAQFLFPYVNGSPDNGLGAKTYGFGAGIQLRID